DPLPPHRDERVARAQVDAHVDAEHSKYAIKEHGGSASCLGGRLPPVQVSIIGPGALGRGGLDHKPPPLVGKHRPPRRSRGRAVSSSLVTGAQAPGRRCAAFAAQWLIATLLGSGVLVSVLGVSSTGNGSVGVISITLALGARERVLVLLVTSTST